MHPTLISLSSDQRIELDKGSMYVGASEWRVDIHLTESGVDDVHCELNADDTPLKIVDLSGKGVLVNGEVVSEKALSDGDELQIGSARFLLRTTSSDGGSATGNPQRSYGIDEDAWLVELGATVLGPMPGSDIEELIDSSQLTPTDRIRNIHQADWITINKWQDFKQDAESKFDDQDYATQSEGEDTAQDDAFGESPEVSFDTVTPRGMREKPIFAATPQPLVSRTTSNLTAESNATDATAQNIREHFFVVLAHREEGPVPLSAIQELADRELVKPLSPMRRESERTWTTAQLYGIKFSDPYDESFDVPADHITNRRRPKPSLSVAASSNQNDVPVDLPKTQTPKPTKPISNELEKGSKKERGIPGTLLWCVVAPWYYVTTGVASVQSMKPQQIAAAVIVLAVGWYFAAGWMRGWTQTALTGVLTMDDKPLADVLITASGLATGESALGVTDSDGDFRLITVHGRLKPGTYHIVIQRQTDADSKSPHDEDEIEIPTKYQDITTTDATIDVAEETEHVEINLTAKRRHRYIH